MKIIQCPYCNWRLDKVYKEVNYQSKGDEIPPGTFHGGDDDRNFFAKLMDKVRDYGERALDKDEKRQLQVANGSFDVQCPKCKKLYQVKVENGMW